MNVGMKQDVNKEKRERNRLKERMNNRISECQDEERANG
jgi:hypothetical protein